MQTTSFLARSMGFLLHQSGEDDPEIRALSLRTLNDDDLISCAALFWTQLCWFAGLAISGWTWITLLMITDAALWLARWRLRRGRNAFGLPAYAGSETASAWTNLVFMSMISIEILTLLLVPSERTSYLAVILAIGFSGYAATMFSAFPRLASVNLILLDLALGLGLQFGFSAAARPLAPLSIAGCAAFWLLTRRSHVNLLGAIRAQSASRKLSLHDPLTKLPNRTLMRETLKRQLATLGTPDGPRQIAVLCLDLDGFKAVNDRYGHAAGDWVLVHVADILGHVLRAGDIACRIGGDEYVVLLAGAAAEQVRLVAQRIIDMVAVPVDIGRTIPTRIGVSIGGAVTGDCTTSIEQLLEQADAALYRAKRGGKGQLVLCDASPSGPAAGPMTGPYLVGQTPAATTGAGRRQSDATERWRRAGSGDASSDLGHIHSPRHAETPRAARF